MAKQKNYKLRTGPDARQALNDLGYGIGGQDNKELAIVALIIAMAEEIEDLRKRIDAKNPQ